MRLKNSLAFLKPSLPSNLFQAVFAINISGATRHASLNLPAALHEFACSTLFMVARNAQFEWNSVLTRFKLMIVESTENEKNND